MLLRQTLGRLRTIRRSVTTGQAESLEVDDEYLSAKPYWALTEGHSDIVDIIVQQPNIDYNIKDEYGDTLGHVDVDGKDVKCVELIF